MQCEALFQKGFHIADGKCGGKIEGKIKEKVESARAMLAEGFDMATIARLIKLAT